MQIGDDVVIGKFTDIKCDDLVKIGNHVSIDSFFYCSTSLTIKNYVHLGPHISIIGGENGYCEIGNFSGMAAGCRIICATDSYQGNGLINPLVPLQYRDTVLRAPVILEDFVTLATNVIVFPGVKLAQGSVISAGSIVTKNTEPWHIYAGTPARPIAKRNKDKIIQYAKELGYDYQ